MSSTVLERRRMDDGIVALVSKRLEDDGFLVAFTERTGGVSEGRFSTLNLGLGTEDDPDRVRENRRRACRALGIEAFSSGRQSHGAKLVRVGPKRSRAGFGDRATAPAGVDALATSSSGVPLAVMTADCVPLALCDRREGALAVVHGGWRGIASGILTVALRAFADTSRLAAVIGPAVGMDHYEVGDDVASAVSTGTEGHALARRRKDRTFLDLAGTTERVLKEHGVGSIERAQECTACLPERFFSYRRDGRTGLQALIAVRLDR